MPLTWLYRFASRTHLLVPPGVLVLASVTVYVPLWLYSEQGQILQSMPVIQFAGTLGLFTIMPGYLLAMMILQWQRTERSLAELGGAVDGRHVERVRRRIHRLHPAGFPIVVLGVAFGASQNLLFVQRVYEQMALNAMDVAFVAGNCLVWGMVALLLSWRLPVSLALSRMGSAMDVDLYRLDKLRPLGRVATTDILVVAGAMAFMPLQSLDAEFRIYNYSAGIAVGVPSAITLFVLPLWGVRGNIRNRKADRVRNLRATLETLDRQDVAALETVTAHIDRVRSMPNWPIDLQLAARIVGYVVIPPLAWIGAAVVEGLVDKF